MTRIQTTHVGSLPRPHDLLDLMKARLAGQSYDRERYASRVKSAVAECVRRPQAFSRSGRTPKAAMATLTATSCTGESCSGGGSSADGTLTYRYATTPKGRQFTVQQRQDGAMGEVLRSEVSAE